VSVITGNVSAITNVSTISVLPSLHCRWSLDLRHTKRCSHPNCRGAQFKSTQLVTTYLRGDAAGTVHYQVQVPYETCKFSWDQIEKFRDTKQTVSANEECRPLGWYAVWLLQPTFRRNLVPPSADTANVVPSSSILVTLMTEALRTSETSVLTRVTRRYIQENGILHSHCCENLKSYTVSAYINGCSNRPLLLVT
jgi:hypothetical protein